MQKFRLTMMCSSCKWRIEKELNSKGFHNFDIDMESSIMTFNEEVNARIIIAIITNISYKIEELDAIDFMSDEELELLEDELNNDYSME